MKKLRRGCFLVSLIFLTVLIAFGIYYFKYEKNKVTEFIKPVVISSLKHELSEKVDKLEANRFKDSLRSIIKDYITVLEKRRDKDLEWMKSSQFMNNLKIILDERKVDSLEINNLKNLFIRDLIKNERPEKNGN